MIEHINGYRVGKRLFDASVAAVLLVCLAPLLAVIAAGVWLTSGRPIIFSQVRPGRGGIPFTIYKFRTMRSISTSGNRSESARLTAFGRILRRTSLDELPELFNVLRGDMSLVGPRPLLTEYLPYYTDIERMRHSVRPGITGWAQVNGRNALTWDERLALDVWYVQNRSFRLDMGILLKTIAAVAGARGVQIDPRSVMDDLHVERSRYRG